MKTNLYTRSFWITLVLSFPFWANSQTVVNIPDVEEVWGGRINAMASYAKSADSTGLYISTESANSIFYTTLYNPVGSGYTFTRFRVLPTANTSANLGSAIQILDVHAASGTLFFVNNGLYSTSYSATSLTLIDNGNISDIRIKDSVLIYLKGTQLYWGTINSSGTYTQSASAPINIGASPNAPVSIEIDPKNYHVYIMGSGYSTGTTPTLRKSSSYFYNLSNTTSFSSLSMGSYASNTYWTGLGISPSGRIFMGGHETVGYNNYKAFRYSDNGSTWTNISTTISGVTGTNFAFSGSESSYLTCFAKCYSTNQGTSWLTFGNTSFQTHPNDGAVCADPNDSLTFFMTTDQGIGRTLNGGSVIAEMDRGVEAVQVNDLSMTTDKNTAWIASKAGIRKVSNYTTIKTWSRAMFPNGDGSPYYSVEMKTGDTNTVFVGNVRVYKTTNGGNTWSQVFTPENAPYSWPQTAIRCEAIEVCKWNSNIVMAGYMINDSNAGGLFYSLDGGTTWNQQYLYASSGYKDVDVYDTVFNIEGTDTVAYVGVYYDLSYPGGRSVYKLVKNGSSWTVSQDMNGATTSTGTLIVATIRDVYRSSTGDTVYAVGTDAGVNHPIAYYKHISGAGKWTPLTTSGFPFSTGSQGYAITQGVDTLYVAVEHEIYYLPSFSSSWKLGYSYPNGTEINFLYYDELLVGTESGLYGHRTFEPQGANLALTVFLQGLHTSGSTMTAAPYNSNPSLSSSIADTIYVELHLNVSPYTAVDTVTALLGTNGTVNLTFDASTGGGTYYIVVKHRNSVETWSANAVTLTSSASYNFSTAASMAYGNNLKQVGPSLYAIYCGDIDQDGTIDFSDYSTLDTHSVLGTTGYHKADLNGDGTVDFSDYPMIDNNNNAGIAVSKPN